MAQKLVFIDNSFLNVKTNTGNIYNAFANLDSATDNNYYYSLVFLNDGNFATHGKIFRTLNSTNVDRGLSIQNGKIGITNTITQGSIGPNSNSSTSIVIPNISYNSYGLITSTSSVTATLNHVLSEPMGNGKTIYLIGKESSSSGTAKTLLHSNILITTDSSGNATLNVPKLLISGNSSQLVFLYSENSTSITKTILDLINEVATLAMVFKDAKTGSLIIALSSSNVNNGDTYKVVNDNPETLTAANFADGTAHTVRTGDVLIAQKTGTTVKWVYIPSADDDVVTSIKIGSGTAQTGAIILGTAAGRNYFTGTIASTSSSDDLVNVSQIVAYVNSQTSGIQGTVTSISPGEGLLSAASSSGTWGTSAITTSGFLKLDKPTTSTLGGIIASNVLTSEVTLTSANGNTTGRYYGVLIDKNGKAFVNVPWLNDTNTWRSIVIDYNTTGQSNTTIGTATNTGAFTLKRGTNVNFSYASNVLTISSVNTWRPFYAWSSSNFGSQGDTIDLYSTGQEAISFSDTFMATAKTYSETNVMELDIVWAEVAANGAITYHV